MFEPVVVAGLSSWWDLWEL